MVRSGLSGEGQVSGSGSRSLTPRLLDRLSGIGVFVFDVDGVLTDGTLYVLPDGTLARRMHIHDGFAMYYARSLGYDIAVITGARAEGVRQRLARLGITKVYAGIEDKAALLRRLVQEHEWYLPAVLYMGDDLPDLPVAELVGCFACPADAVPEVRRRAHYVCLRGGGQGCAREVIELVLRLHGRWGERYGLDSSVTF